MSYGFNYMKNLLEQRHPLDTSFPAMLMDSQFCAALCPDAAVKYDLPTSIYVYMPLKSEDDLAFPKPEVFSLVHAEGSTPFLLIRNNFPNYSHVLVLPLLTKKISSFLRAVYKDGSRMSLIYEASNFDLGRLLTFNVSPVSIVKALDRCLDLKSAMEIETAMLRIWGYVNREQPNSETQITSVVQMRKFHMNK